MAKNKSKNKKIKKSKPAAKKTKKPAKVAKKKATSKKKPAKPVSLKSKKKVAKKVLPKKQAPKKTPVVKKDKTPKITRLIKGKAPQPGKVKPVIIEGKPISLKGEKKAVPSAIKKGSAKTVTQAAITTPAEPVIAPLKVTVKSGPRKPEPKGKYIMEFSVRSSIPVLFEFVSTPSGLEEWFSDSVHVQTGGFFTFFWDGVGQQAKLIGYKDQELVRFEWLSKKDGSYFEFRIQTDELTGDVSLIVTDFADPAELQTNKLVWESQVDKLLHIIGSYSP